MRTRNDGGRRPTTQARADRHAQELARRLGRVLRAGRRDQHTTQTTASARVGISQSAWSRLELGDPHASLELLVRAAFALGGSLDAFMRRTSATALPRDAVHLRHQELVISTAAAGGWRALAIARMSDDLLPQVAGCWVVRATRRNRALVREHRHTFQARFPGSSRAWLAALRSSGSPMPDQPAVLWVSMDGRRLFPARLG